MRDYGVVSPKFWIGSTGKALRGNRDAQIVALYLMTGPHASSTGVYHCPVLYIAHETGLSIEDASKALASLIEGDFCHYDEASEWVFVHQMARFQVGESVSMKDKRHKWLLKEMESMPNSLRQQFLLLYGLAFELCTDEEHERAMQAPSKPLRSQDLDHGQEQDLEQDHGQCARENVPRETFDGWKFVDERLRPAYPRGTFRHTHWLTASRAVERLVGDGADPDEIVANAAAYCAQQEAMGNAGTQFVMAPTKFLADENWRGPFDVPMVTPKRSGAASDRVTWRPDA